MSGSVGNRDEPRGQAGSAQVAELAIAGPGRERGDLGARAGERGPGRVPRVTGLDITAGPGSAATCGQAPPELPLAIVMPAP
jgi:hypothetical protein